MDVLNEMDFNWLSFLSSRACSRTFCSAIPFLSNALIFSLITCVLIKGRVERMAAVIVFFSRLSSARYTRTLESAKCLSLMEFVSGKMYLTGGKIKLRIKFQDALKLFIASFSKNSFFGKCNDFNFLADKFGWNVDMQIVALGCNGSLKHFIKIQNLPT